MVTFKHKWVLTTLLLFGAALFPATLSAQEEAEQTPRSKSDFWQHVQFGGSLGVGFGSGYTEIMLAPSAIYHFNQYFALGFGLQGSYSQVKFESFSVEDPDEYESWIYGGNLIGLFNPIPEIQLSTELEQVRVNTTYSFPTGADFDDDFWNTALFLGIGYRTQNVTIGMRYNVLFDRDKSVYAEPFMPFVRVYF